MPTYFIGSEELANWRKPAGSVHSRQPSSVEALQTQRVHPRCEEQSTDAKEGAHLAAKSLQTLLLNDGVRTIDFDAARAEVGRLALRDSDYIRKQEDALLRRLARAYCRAQRTDREFRAAGQSDTPNGLKRNNDPE